MPRNAQALILDFGGVVTRILFETHPLSEAALGLPPGSLNWRGPFDPAQDSLWRSMQADDISERQYWQIRTQEVAALTGADWTEMSDFVRAVRGDAPAAIIRPEFHDAIHEVKNAGIHLAILSNELDLFYGAEFRDKLPFLEAFDIIHDATYTRVLKPDPRAYQACLAELELPAEQCVFVDDQMRNVKGAQAVGLLTTHFNVLEPAHSYNATLRLLGLRETDT